MQSFACDAACLQTMPDMVLTQLADVQDRSRHRSCRVACPKRTVTAHFADPAEVGSHGLNPSSDRLWGCRMLVQLRAAAEYFAIVFSAGFVLGAFRTFVVAPRTGELLATLIELPIMLVIAWFACRWIMRRFRQIETVRSTLVVGGAALLFVLTDGRGTAVCRIIRSFVQPASCALQGAAGSTRPARANLFCVLPADLSEDHIQLTCFPASRRIVPNGVL